MRAHRCSPDASDSVPAAHSVRSGHAPRPLPCCCAGAATAWSGRPPGHLPACLVPHGEWKKVSTRTRREREAWALRHFTAEEQRELAQHVGCVDLPQASGDTEGEPVGTKLFACAQFQDALGNFKKLLSSGVFDPSSTACASRMTEHYNKLTSITDLASDHWHEKLPLLALRSRRRGGPAASSVEWKEAHYERCWGEKQLEQAAEAEPSSAGNPVGDACKKESAFSEDSRPQSDDAAAAPAGRAKWRAHPRGFNTNSADGMGGLISDGEQSEW
ncbi:hypothetical protein CYMTET_8191 [Cymbomonas tetramitiformis]|uniref:Uncharacterized protein n=1 Tax=Cymbomonas tetramitiformis TaxID=36881 RepID=A0AAE0LG90_9CHLO|nr:hypothetical protein CYMTET_8191 [Cymbomonas tetramitiformis]